MRRVGDPEELVHLLPEGEVGAKQTEDEHLHVEGGFHFVGGGEGNGVGVVRLNNWVRVSV